MDTIRSKEIDNICPMRDPRNTQHMRTVDRIVANSSQLQKLGNKKEFRRRRVHKNMSWKFAHNSLRWK